MENKFIGMCCLILGGVFISCEEDYQPKPNGYHRITTLEKEFIDLETPCPYTFEYPSYLDVQMIDKDKCWMNLHSDYYNATLHLTYRPVNNNLEKSLINFTRLTYEHTKRADGIDEVLYEDPEHKVYSIYYQLHGPSASSLQFIATDSFNHILRGALYFNNIPNVDSIRPVHEEYKQDIQKMIETLRWEDTSK